MALSPRALGTDDVGPSHSDTCDTDLCGGLLRAWGRLAQDPGAHVADWCWQGAPAGIVLDPDLDALFPRAEVDPSRVSDPASLCGRADGFSNYAGFDSDPVAVAEVLGFADRSPPYLLRCPSLDAARRFLGQEPILSRSEF